jgi:hypothetical protein
MRVLRHFVGLLWLLAPACSSTGVGNPSAEMKVTVVNDLTAEPQATDPQAQLTPSALRHAVLVFGELRFIPCDISDGDVVLPGPFVVDLAASKVEPPLPAVPVPPGGFCGLDAPLTTTASQPALQGRSILFSGLRGDGTLFILYAAMQGTLHMRPLTNVTWDLATNPAVLWAFRPHRWLMPAELDAADTEALGAVLRVIVIDVDRHPLLLDAIRQRIGGRTTLHTDLNDNSQLDPDERVVPAWIGQGLPSLD